LAAALGRRIGAVLAGLVLVGAAALVAASTVGFLSDPAAPVRSAAAELSGVPELDGAATTTPWPALAIVLAVALLVLGVVTLVASRRWQAAGRRFERDTPAPGPRSAASRATDDRTRAMDDWDALGRGEDPSQPAGPGTGAPEQPSSATTP
ncbi:Trp biosynthesis-associated membrane protein, partial [Georgenia subflava]